MLPRNSSHIKCANSDGYRQSSVCRCKMNCLDVVRAQQKLDALYNRLDPLQMDAETQSHWTKYLCIMTSAYLEVCIRAIYRQYALSRAPATSEFVSKQLDGMQNPNVA